MYNGELLNQSNINMVHGDLDTVVKTAKLTIEVARLNNPSRIQTIPDVGHMSIWEKPAALIQCLATVVSAKV